MRRYKIGDHPIYDKMYDRLMKTSPILNGAAATFDSGWSNWKNETPRWLRGRLERHEQEVILQAKAAVKDVEEDFEFYQRRQQAEGKSIPDAMPEHLQVQMERAEAYLDIKTHELSWLRKRLQQRLQEEAAQQAARQPMLKGGPRGIGKLRNGVLIVIDGQPVKQNGNGELLIDCPESRYHKLTVHIYRTEVVKPFLKLKAQELDRRYAEAKQKQTPIGEIEIKPVAWPPCPKIKTKTEEPNNDTKKAKRPAQAKTTTSKGH